MEINFDTTNGRFDFISADLPGAGITGASAWVSYRQSLGGKLQRVDTTITSSSIDDTPVTDVHGHAIERVIEFTPLQGGIKLVYRGRIYLDQPFVLLQISVRNLGVDPVYLEECCLVDAGKTGGGKIDLGELEAGLKFYKVGWHGWDYAGVQKPNDRNSGGLVDRLTRLSYTNPATQKLGAAGEFSSEGWAVLAGEEAALVAGLVSTDAQFGQVYACIRSGEEALSLVTQMDGVRLDPGEQRESEWGYLQFISLPCPEPAAGYIEAVARQMGARVPINPPPPMWTHWYQYFQDISEQLFIQNLDVLLEHRKSYPCQLAELDDGFEAAWGDWTTTNAKFPHGLGWLAEQVRGKGFTPGIWLAPFVVQSGSQLMHDHPDWLVMNERGRPASAGFVYNMLIKGLDLTRAEVLEHVRNLAHTLAQDWGYSMLKIDFLNAGAIPGRRFDPKMTRAQALRKGLEAIREGAGSETTLLGCGCPFGPAIGIVDAMRIGPDTAPSWTPYFNWMKWIGPLVRNNRSMPALRNALRNTLNLSPMHQAWWWNDPDCLLIRSDDSKLTGAEVQSMITLVGLSGGMLVSSDDLRQVSPERLSWMSKLVPNLRLRGLPLDVLEQDMPSIYRVNLEYGGQEWQVVALFNWNEKPGDVSLDFSRLGYESEAALHVFDFWQESYLKTSEVGIVFHAVPSHGCKLLRVCKVGESPQVVGDTLHISMGAEIRSLRIANELVEVETMEMGRLVEGKVWVWTGKDVMAISINNQDTKVTKDTT